MDRRYVIAASFLALLALVAGLIFVYRAFFPKNPPLPPPEHEVYVANLGGHSILGFAIDSSGRVAATPGRVIQGQNTALHNPIDVALDGSKRIYVTNLGDPVGNNPSITVYSADANGDAQPIRIINQFNLLGVGDLERPISLVIRPQPENILLTDQSLSAPGPSRILELSTIAGQNDPIGRIQGSASQLRTPAGIALDQAQRIYVAEPQGNRILIYIWPGQEFIDLSPFAIIEGAATLLNNPVDLGLDSQGNLYVVNRGTFPHPSSDAGITVYASAALAPGGAFIRNIAPIRRLGGPSTPNANLVDPNGIALDAAGRIFVTQSNSFQIFPSGANGNASHDQIINDQTINNPVGIVAR
jgi:hypothetical protein